MIGSSVDWQIDASEEDQFSSGKEDDFPRLKEEQDEFSSMGEQPCDADFSDQHSSAHSPA